MISIILVALFFVSGADAASVVMGMLSSKGNLHPKSWNIIVWGVFTGSAAAVCLLAGAIQGSVDAALLALQSVAIASAAPFVLILIGLCFSIMKALRAERLPTAAPGREAPEPGRAAPAHRAPRHRSRCRRRTPTTTRKARIQTDLESQHGRVALRPSARRIRTRPEKEERWADAQPTFGGSWTT